MRRSSLMVPHSSRVWLEWGFSRIGEMRLGRQCEQEEGKSPTQAKTRLEWGHPQRAMTSTVGPDLYWPTIEMFPPMKVAAPAWAIDKSLPGKIPRISVADTVSNRAIAREVCNFGMDNTGASSRGLV